ncbi:MAG: diacylglycerol kinase family protein [Patescibacteria group bacterium]
MPRMAVLASPNTGSYPTFEREIRPLLNSSAQIFLTSNRAELIGVVDQLHQLKPDIIVIAGGDGAMHVCLTAIADRYQRDRTEIPSILMLALGTMNDGATALGVDRPVSLLKRVNRKLARGDGLETRLFRPMTVNGECAFLYGAGLPVAFLQRYYRDKPPGAIGGPIGGGMTIGTAIWSEILIELGLADNRGWLQRLLSILGLREATGLLNSLLAEFGQLDAQEWEEKNINIRIHSSFGATDEQFRTYTGLMATVIDQIGLGLRAFRDAMKHGSSFTLRTTELSLTEILVAGPAILTSLRVPGINDTVHKEAIIEYRQPTVRMIDGDLKEPAMSDTLGMGPTLEIITG